MIKQYLYDIFGIQPKITPFINKGQLPLILDGNYAFYTATIKATTFVLMVDRHIYALSPNEIQKQCQLAEQILNKKAVYVTDKLPAQQRKRLVAHRVQFIVPYKQLYMPSMGVALTEDKEEPLKRHDHLSICANEILLLLLNKLIATDIYISDLIATMPYSRQTISVAIEALESNGLLTKENIGQKKILHFPKDKQFFNKILSLMNNPVHTTIGLYNLPINKYGAVVDAGITLLAQQTMLAEPNYKEKAITQQVYNKIKHTLHTLPVNDAPIVLQIWERNPLLPNCEKIDNISLYLSLKEDKDERTQMALEEVLKQIKW